MATPWFKFYPSDWRADPALQMCSLAARGLWMEWLQIMHEAEPRGHLLVNGRVVSLEQLSKLVGASEDEVQLLSDELEGAGVFSRKKNGVIYSRKMVKDENLSRKRRENGKMGGNPTLCKTIENQGLVNHDDKPKSLEARSQKLERKSHGSTVSGQAGASFSNKIEAQRWFWSSGVEAITRTTDKSQQQAKSALGVLLKRCKEDVLDAANLLRPAIEADAQDVIGHCTAQIAKRKVATVAGEKPVLIGIPTFDDRFNALQKRSEDETGKRKFIADGKSWFPKKWVMEVGVGAQ